MVDLYQYYTNKDEFQLFIQLYSGSLEVVYNNKLIIKDDSHNIGEKIYVTEQDRYKSVIIKAPP